MKKFFASLLITLMVFGNVAVLTTPQRAQAFLGFGDISFDPPTTIGVIKQVVTEVGKGALKRLANKVLNKMLKKTVNWAITGFGPWEDGSNSGGQPFYVQNQDSLLKNIEDQQLISTIQGVGDSCNSNECPYAKDLARSLVTSALNKDKTPVFDLDKYSPNWKAFTEEGKFSEGGGWKTWEGMNRNPQNSPFGAYLSSKTTVEEKKATAVLKQEKELVQNDGFLSLRKCVEYAPGKEPASEIDFSKFKTQKPITSSLPPDQGGAIDITGTPGSANTTGAFGSAPPTPPATFSASKKYNAGDTVTFAKNIFEAKKSTQVNVPPTSQSDNEFWKFISGSGTTVGQATGVVSDALNNTYALPGLTVDNCIRYETTTPGSMAKEMLGKTLTGTIDKQIADSSSGSSIVDSLVDMAAVFITNGLDKMITKATTKTGDQKIYAGGIGATDENTITLGVGNGANTNSAWYSADGKNPIEIQSPYDSNKLHPDLQDGIEKTKLEIAELETLLQTLRAQPAQFKELDECLPGPDLNWEKRLNDEFNRSIAKLNKKEGKKNENKSEKAQDAITKLERYKTQEVSNTKLSMLSIIPSSISIMSKLSQVSTLSAELISNEKKYSQRVGALNTLEAIQTVLANGNLDNATLVTLKKQYSGIKQSVSTDETLEDTISDKEAALSDVEINFNKKNPNSLISKCIAQRKTLADDIIGQDIGEKLFCNWEEKSTKAYSNKKVPNILFGGVGATTVGVSGGAVGNGTSPYDPGRSVQIWIGGKYTQDESPWKCDTCKDYDDFEMDCDKFYRASLSFYEDQK